MKKAINKVLAVSLVAIMSLMIFVGGTTMVSAESSTGVGLASHALTAYREGWSYVWGGTSYGAVDCSGLIASYNGVGGMRTDMLASSSEWGYVSEGIPRIHGLGLHHPGHIGVYIGSGMAVDARDENSGVVYHNVYSMRWVEWFKVAGVSYPQNGWVLLDGDSYYYEDGEYVINTSRTIDGVTYSFDGAGVSDIAPPSSAYQATDYSTASAPQGSIGDAKTEQKTESSQVYEEESSEESIEESSEEESIEESSEESIEESSEESIEESSEESIEESSEESVEESSEESIEESSEESIEESSEESVEESSEESIEESSEESVEESSEESIEESSEESVEESSEESIEESSEESIEESSEESIEESSEESIEESSEESIEESSEESIEESSEESIEESSEESIEESSKESKKEESKPKVVKIAEYGDEDTGDSNKIAEIQTRLYELGYLSQKATGYFGSDMIDAVMIFQDINGLDVTGIVDSETYKVLKSKNAESNFVLLETGSSDSESTFAVSALQERLTELKYFYGDVTGYYSELTVNAVKAFQKDNKIDVTGIADEETQLKIFSKDAKVNPNAGSVMYGMSGDMVTKMQKRLIELRYLSGDATGKFDKKTLEAVHAYQKAAGLEQADLLTEKQLNVLYSDNAPKSPDYAVMKYGYSGDDVTSLQEQLAGLKYYDGKTSGVYGNDLAASVKNFQKDNDLKETGYADEDTVNTIKIETQRENSQAGSNLILKTSEVADNALAGLAETKTEQLAAEKENNDNLIKNGIIFGIVILLAGVAAVVFIIKLRSSSKKNAYGAAVTVVDYRKKK